MGTPNLSHSDAGKRCPSPMYRVIPILDVVSALLALGALLPIAGGFPSIASTGDALIDGMWFTVILGGPFLLLAGGLNLAFPSVPSPWFIVVYVATIGLLGIMRLSFAGFNLLTPGWLVLVCCVGGLLLMHRQPWAWAMLGGAWCVVILGLGVTALVMAYTSPNPGTFPLFFVVFTTAGFSLSIAVVVVHFRQRRQASAA